MCFVCRPTASKEQDVEKNHSGKTIRTKQQRPGQYAFLHDDSWVNTRRLLSAPLKDRLICFYVDRVPSPGAGYSSVCQSPMRSDWSECVWWFWSSGMCHGIGSGGSAGPAHEQTVSGRQTHYKLINLHINVRVNVATAAEIHDSSEAQILNPTSVWSGV